MDSDGSYEFYVEAIREFEVFGKVFAICLGSHFERFAKLLMLVSLSFFKNIGYLRKKILLRG